MAKPRLGEMSSEVGGPGLEGPYGKGTQAPRAHKVYAKIANCLKNSTTSVKIGPIREISAAHRHSDLERPLRPREGHLRPM